MHVQHRDRGGLRAVPAGRTPGPHQEGKQPKLMMYDAQQSDAAIVAMKAANKGARAPAEPLERRAAAERNPRSTGTVRTQSRGAVSPGAERIRQFAKENPGEKLTALLHHITTETLEAAYLALKRDAAPGVDGVTWREYGDGLAERLLDLKDRVHSGAYRAAPVRRVEIPKPDGGMRQLGIASLEDKIVQRAVVEQILTPIYESEFYGFNYGFRPGRSAHDALDALAYALERRKVNWIVEVDIREFFDSIDREQLMQFLEMRIGDRRVLRLIRKWLNAGVIEAGLEVDVARGTPQGAVISPLLANVYLHHVLDDWFAREWRPREVWGEAYIVRYADDFVLGFQYRRDAERFMEALRERFAAFGLGVHRRRRAWWSSGGSRKRTGVSAGRVDRRRSTSLGSRTTAGQRMRGVSGWGASPLQSGCVAHCRRSKPNCGDACTRTRWQRGGGLGGYCAGGWATTRCRRALRRCRGSSGS